MFCGKCGEKNADDAVFCKRCGAEMNKATPSVKEKSSRAPINKHKVVSWSILTAILVLAVAAFVLFGGRGYEKTVSTYIESSINGNARAIYNMLPRDILNYVLEEEDYEKNEFIEIMEEELQDMLAQLDRQLGDWKITYEITGSTDLTKKEVRLLKEEYEDDYVELNISKAKTVQVNLNIRAKETKRTTTLNIPVIKVGRAWYLDITSLSSIF